MEHRGEHRREPEKQGEGEVDRRRVEDEALREVGEGRGIGGDRLVAQHHLRDAAVERHGADGDDDRGQAEARHQDAVDGPARRPGARR